MSKLDREKYIQSVARELLPHLEGFFSDGKWISRTDWAFSCAEQFVNECDRRMAAIAPDPIPDMPTIPTNILKAKA